MVGMTEYVGDTRGQVGVIFALATLPLIALTSAALDYSQLTKERNAISSGLDAAVLAAANNNAIEEAEKHLYAETHFLANYSGELELNLTPSLEADRVRLTAEGELELSFGNLVGIENLPVFEASAATLANEVFKDPSGQAAQDYRREWFLGALTSGLAAFQDTGSLSSAVQAFFSYELDPIYDVDMNDNIEISQNRTGSDVDIKPGVFCGGLTVDGINVDFLPGEYIMKDGPISFINGAEAVAKDVTFILSGTGSVLNIQSQSAVLLKAPSEGVRRGLAVMEAVDRSGPANRKPEEKNSMIAEGGSLQVTGTIYLPQQKLEIMGKNTAIGSMAPATSFIADTLHISGGAGARMDIGVDHVEAGVPPIQPRAEDGARLVE